MTPSKLPIPAPPSRPYEPLRLRDASRNRSFCKSLERKADTNINDRDHEELESKPEGEINDVEDEGDRVSRDNEDVGTEDAETEEADHQPS